MSVQQKIKEETKCNNEEEKIEFFPRKWLEIRLWLWFSESVADVEHSNLQHKAKVSTI